MSSDEVVDDDSFLAFRAVFEADDDHAVALGAFAPAIRAVVFADFAEFDEREIAGGADVVVADCCGGGIVVAGAATVGFALIGGVGWVWIG
jgi:hypothetical protein